MLRERHRASPSSPRERVIGKIDADDVREPRMNAANDAVKVLRETPVGRVALLRRTQLHDVKKFTQIQRPQRPKFVAQGNRVLGLERARRRDLRPRRFCVEHGLTVGLTETESVEIRGGIEPELATEPLGGGGEHAVTLEISVRAVVEC